MQFHELSDHGSKSALARAVREAGRRLQAGKAYDEVPLADLVNFWSAKHPRAGAVLDTLLQAAKEEARKGDRESAIANIRKALGVIGTAEQY